MHPDPKPMRPEAVVFDIGNVLIRWDPDLLYRQIFPDAVERQAFLDETGMYAVNLEVDRGAPFAATITAHAAKFPHYAEAIRAWATRWDEMIPGPIEASVSILEDLRSAGIPIFALSNFGTDTFAHAERRFPFLRAFDQRFISGPLGCIKPDPEIYAHLEQATGLSGGALFFADDSRTNIDAARARGWQAYHFETAEGLRSELERLLIL